MDINRKTAYLVLLDVEENVAYSNLALNQQLKIETPESPAFVRELVYGVLENKYYLDFVVNSFVEKPGRIKSKERTLLRMGVYQLFFMDSVPEYAAVNEMVALAKKYCRGKDGFINGVLRKAVRQREGITLPDPQKEPVEYLSIRYSYAPWIIELWVNEWGWEQTELLLAAGNETPSLVVRTNTLKLTPKELQIKLEAQGIHCQPSTVCGQGLLVQGSHVLSSDLYQSGAFSVQDESSMLAVQWLDPRPGQTIMDICAAPGGKTGCIAERMENRGRIIAGDFYPQKLKLIEQQMKRTGVSIVEMKQWDGGQVQEEFLHCADGVLVDAPCSGLGVIRRKPEIKYKEQKQMLAELSDKQGQILRVAAGYVKSGGCLLYSTCTISSLENQQVISKFLNENPIFSKVEERQLLPHVDHTDGFYICKMIRN